MDHTMNNAGPKKFSIFESMLLLSFSTQIDGKKKNSPRLEKGKRGKQIWVGFGTITY